jgi:DNA-nicking Smr family endonuclease
LEEEPVEIPITDTLDLHAFAPADVKGLVEEYLEQCEQRGYRYIRIIHGKGTGVQKKIVRSVLERSPLVESFSDGPDWGSTSVVLCNTGSRAG